MTPEVKIDKEKFYVLQKIKEEYLRQAKKQIIEINIEEKSKESNKLDFCVSINNQVKNILSLESNGIIKIVSKETYYESYCDTIKFYLEIIQPKFDKYYKRLSDSSILNRINSPVNLISKDPLGNYYYINRLISFKNNKCIYFHVFEILYTKSMTDNPVCLYKDIIDFVSKKIKSKNKDTLKMIRNAKSRIFRYSDLPTKAENGSEIIKTVHGIGLQLYNPKI